MDITDDFMRKEMEKTAGYTVVILHTTTKASAPGAEQIIWEHGRRNFELRAEGKLNIVCPIRDESDISGVGIFHLSLEETRFVMEGDPGVREGIFTYELHATRSFPGDSLLG